MTDAVDETDPWHDDDVGSSTLGGPWQPRPWWAWSTVLVLLGAASLLSGGLLLADARLGTTLRTRACDPSALPGLALLALGAAATLIAGVLARLRAAGAVLGMDPSTLAITVPLPATVLVATMPGVLGCRLAADVADVAVVGPALVGQPGLMVAATAAAICGAVVASVVHVSWLAPPLAQPDDPPGIVERAIQELEAMQRDSSATRFRGVDDER